MMEVDEQVERDNPLIHLNNYKLVVDANDHGLSDDVIDPKKFKERLQIVIVHSEENSLEFDIIGMHPALANAFRRLMISEVPSMAIEKVYIQNNTSVMQDEVLAHRLGLLPLRADPRRFKMLAESVVGVEEDTVFNEENSLEYEIKVKCTRRKDFKTTSTNSDVIYKNNKVYTSQMKWLPKGKQAQLFSEADVGCIHDDILITQLRGGHELDLRLIAVKGIGKDHAKFSPVCTAFYRMMPKIQLKRSIQGSDAHLLQKLFSPGVIGISKDGGAFVKDARYDSGNRNAQEHPHFENAVEVSRVRDHFIFTVESLGAWKPQDIFIEAVTALKAKCQKFLKDIDNM